MQCDLQLLRSLFQESVYIDMDFLYSKVPDLQFLIQLFLLQQYFLVLQLLRFYLQSKFLHLTESRISFQFLLSQAYPQFLF